jgi:hypothetical protein
LGAVGEEIAGPEKAVIPVGYEGFKGMQLGKTK